MMCCGEKMQKVGVRKLGALMFYIWKCPVCNKTKTTEERAPQKWPPEGCH